MPRTAKPPQLDIRRQPGSQPMYEIVWREFRGEKQRKSTGIPATGRDAEKDAATAFFEEWLRERRRERQGDRPGSAAEVAVTDVIVDYVREHRDRVASEATLDFSARPLLFYFRDDTMATLTPVRVETYWAWRRCHAIEVLDAASGKVEAVSETQPRQGRGARPAGRPIRIGDGTIVRELVGVLRPAIKHAVDNRRLEKGEYKVPVPALPAGRDYWITRSEAARLLWETRRDPRSRLHLPLYGLIGVYTGARKGAILDLTWQQIDLIHGIIDFNPPGRVPTDKKRPIIPVPRSLLAALKRAHKRASSNYVIAYDGEPVGNIKTGFNSAAARAGIPECTPHTLRHTAGTWMAQRGVPLHQIAGYLGHTMTRTTELYAHHHPAHMAEAKRAMEGR